MGHTGAKWVRLELHCTGPRIGEQRRWTRTTGVSFEGVLLLATVATTMAGVFGGLAALPGIGAARTVTTRRRAWGDVGSSNEGE